MLTATICPWLHHRNSPPPCRPRPPQPRRWLPAAIIGAAIVIAAAVIAGALIINSGTNTADTTTPASDTPATARAAESSSTCRAWAATSVALKSIPGLPAGWDWDTPDIDTYVANQNAAVKAALDPFESEIAASDPPEVVAAANDYVAAQRRSMQHLADQTYTTAVGVPVTTARVKLDQACGVS
ncbi:MAG: hypothetical protein K0U80_14910 [Actinomycetia bacterium]|nr:hypothetical protein [Actinomycetes bacterium]MCH9761034.1 hypothetical protein [Actinomycetes bacterium]